jgi:1-acyl-sn-glycerol-3-phosphate acyltransferase
VVIGAEKLNHVGPWLPFRRGRLWIAFGDRMIHPPKNITGRRSARRQLAEELGGEYQRLYAETLKAYNLHDSIVP